MSSQREIAFARYWEGKQGRKLTLDVVRDAYLAGWSDKPDAPLPPIKNNSAGVILPCPFCGGEAERVDIDEGENAGGSCICCIVCHASSNLEFGRKENFIANWNRRVPLDQALKNECVVCGLPLRAHHYTQGVLGNCGNYTPSRSGNAAGSDNG